MNYQNRYRAPILGILCDGKSFYFFQFVGQFPAHTPPHFFLGRFPDGSQRIHIELPDPTYDASPDCRTQVRELRRLCDSLYHVFLKSYLHGIEGHWHRSTQRTWAEGKNRASTPEWAKARTMAEEAIKTAISAWDLFSNAELEASRRTVEAAVQLLTERYKFYLLIPVVNAALRNELYYSVESAPFEKSVTFPGFTTDMLNE
jgi:hypothetical protein